MKFRNLVIALVFTTMASVAALAATQTLTGIVSDDMCAKKHTMAAGKPDSECVRECVKAGAHYALVVGDKVYVLKGDATKIDPFAAKKVKVTGDVSGTSISVASIADAK